MDIYILNVSSVITIIKLCVVTVKGKSKKVYLRLLFILLILEHLKMVALCFYGNVKRIYEKVRDKKMSSYELFFEMLDFDF